MAIVVSPPEKVGFSKDVIRWRFEDDRAGIIPGIPSEAVLSISDAVVAGTQIVFRWGENDLRFTAAATPGSYGSEFPLYPEFNITTHEAYVKSLVPYFKDNFFLDQDFDIVADPITISGPGGSVTLWTIKFTARLGGIAYNLTETRFAGGGITPSVDGTDDSTVPNNGVYVEVWIQTPDASMFKKQYGAVQLFDNDSIADFDIAAVLHSNMASEIPDMVLPFAERCTQSRRKYYLRYALSGGKNPSIGPIQQTEEFTVLLGGFQKRKSGPQSLIDTFATGSQYKFLKLRPNLRIVRTDEPVFVSWVNFGASGRNVHARATVTFDDGTQQTTNTNVVSNVLTHEKLLFGVGYKQLSLALFNKPVQEFTIELRDDLGAISEPFRLVVNYAHLEYVRYFAYVNSFGSIETVMTYGKGSASWKVFKEQAQKVLPYTFKSDQAQFVEWNQTYTDNQEVATGWMKKKELIFWLDLFISPLKYRVINGNPYAIQIGTDTIQRGIDGDNQYGLSFEYQFARIFDAVSDEQLEGEDSEDVVPPNVVLAGSLNSSNFIPASQVNIKVDPYPIRGSFNAVSSDGISKILDNYQKKLTLGGPDEYLNGEGKPRNLRTAVNAVEKDPSVPPYAKTLNSFDKIFNQLQGMNPGLNVKLFDGQLADWYIKRMTHPAFDELPPIVVSKGVAFTRYLDLKNYLTSYHLTTDLSVDVTYNALKLRGVQISVDDDLIITLQGKLDESVSNEENAIIAVTDLFRNPAILSLRVQTQETTPVPDNRPDCPLGPLHNSKVAIQIINNGKVRVPFDALGVPVLRWKIVNADTDVQSLRSGTSPNDNGPFFFAEFSPLPGKTYRIGIQGDQCKSPWVYRDLVLPADNTLAWSDGFPKHEVQGSDSAFRAKITASAQLLTELFNLNTNTKVYSATHDYVANETIISITKAGGWPEANYRLNVGTLTTTIKVGNPAEPPAITFKMVGSYNGNTIKDLNTGSYEGPVPPVGYNILFSSTNLGFAQTHAKWFLEIKVGGVWTVVPGVGGTRSAASSSAFSVARLFPNTGDDSRFVLYNGQPLNRYGEFRFTIEFHTGSLTGPQVGVYQQTFKFNLLEITGGWVNRAISGRVVPIVGGVKYNGVNVINNNNWTEPWASSGLGDRRIEYSFDKITWYRTSSWFDGEAGSTDQSNLMLLNSEPTDLFPAGSDKTVYLRNGLTPSVISEGYDIVQEGDGPGSVDIPSNDGVKRTQVGNAKFGIINGKFITAEIRPNGAVKLNYLAQTRSTNGDNDVHAILLDQQMIPVPTDQVNALRSADGLLLENGDYHFYLYYINHALASDVEGIFNEMWRLFKNPDTYRSNSFGMHYCMIEIRGLKNSNSPSEIKEHAGIQSAVWYPQAQLLNYALSFPAGKAFKITKRIQGLTTDQILTKVTGIEARYDDVNNGLIPYAKTYLLGDKAALGAQKSDGHYDFSGQIDPFKTVQVEATIANVDLTDILSDTYKGYRGNIEGNLAFSADILAQNRIRYSITNNGSTPAKVSGGFLYVYVFKNTTQIAQAFYDFGARKDAHVTAELNEGGLPSWAVEDVFKKVYDLQKANEGITSVNQQNMAGDYFQNNYGYGTNAPFLNYRTNKNFLRGLLANSDAARMDSQYYVTAYQYRHRIINGYVDGIGRLLNGTSIYSQIYNIELNYVAMADRKTFMWSWLSFEGVNTEVDRGTEQRLPIASPEGDLIRMSRAESSYEMGKRHIFIGLLLTEGLLMWHDTGKYGTVIEYFDLAYIGGYEPWKTQWQGKDSSLIVTYDKNNPTHPKFVDPAPSRWSDTAAPSHNGGYAGAYIFCQIQNMITDSIRYANFSYTLDGTPHTGYHTGNAPVDGALGNAELSRFGQANPGNHNIIDIWDYNQVGCIITEGPAGKVAIVWNDHAGLTGKTVYTINEFGGRTITHVGTGIGIYDISGDTTPEEPEEPEESATEIFQLVMSTTGYGFSSDPNSTYGVSTEWIERIEAFHYSWGWGISGVSMLMTWDAFEPTPGAYNTANLQKFINYCDDRDLTLSIKWKSSRNEGDGFILPSEYVTGSLGKVYKEGVTGIHPSYGSGRVNALMYPAIQQVATLLGAYRLRGYMTFAGGHTEEMVNHVMGDQAGDFCSDNLARFNTWCTARGLATPGTPPMNHGYNLEWPFPDFNNPRGVEFSRFTAYNLAKAYTNFVNAVKSVSDIKCIYEYAAASNLQLRCTGNAPMRYIAAAGDGMYGSEGDGLYDFDAKLRCNSINLGNFPNGISGIEIDPDDTSIWRYDGQHGGGPPPFGQASPVLGTVKENMKKAYDLGVQFIHWAMAFSVDEIRSMDSMLEEMHINYIGKPYRRPVINSGNLVEREVTARYRASQDIVEGIDTKKFYVKYLNNDFWGGVNPPSDFSL